MSDEFNNPNLDPNEEDDLVELIDENGDDVYNVPDDDVADAVFAKLVEMTEEFGEDDE